MSKKPSGQQAESKPDGPFFQGAMELLSRVPSPPHRTADDVFQWIEGIVGYASEVFDDLKPEELVEIEGLIADLRQVRQDLADGLIPPDRADLFTELIVVASLGALVVRGESRWLTAKQCQEKYIVGGDALRQAARPRAKYRVRKRRLDNGRNLYFGPDVAKYYPRNPKA